MCHGQIFLGNVLCLPSRASDIDIKYCLETAVARFSHLECILCLLVGLAGLLSCTALGIAITELCNVASAHAPVLLASSKHMMKKDTKHHATG